MRITAGIAVVAAAIGLWTGGMPDVLAQGTGSRPPVPYDKLKLLPGFKIAAFAEGLPYARGMALGAKGTVFVGSMNAGQVYALVHKGPDVADEVKIVARGLSKPTGVAFHDGALYVAARTQIVRFDGIEDHLDAPPAPVVLIDHLPAEYHDWKYLAYGPDNLLYFSVGSSCNVCERPDEPRFATIMRMKPDGTGPEIFARGVRNSVGFDWHPVTHEMWFTDNGRDELGDDIPNDELNIAPKAGMNFGFPYCHQGDLLDPDFGKGKSCADYVPPVQKMGPHVAAIGMRFYTGSMFPAEFKNAVFIAQHGSWNRSTPLGYRVMAAKNDGHKVTDYQEFVGGFLHGIRGNPQGNRVNGDTYARPADVLVMKDGSLLVSDEQYGRIFRISYGK